MGKGDIRSRRGKIWRGTYGVSRPAKRKNRTPRPTPVSRKVKTLKDLPKAVEEQVKRTTAETVPSAKEVHEVSAPVDVHIPNVEQAAEAIAEQDEAVHEMQETPEAMTPGADEAQVPKEERKAAKKTQTKKAPAAKKSPAKKVPAAKKPAAKKVPAKKKK